MAQGSRADDPGRLRGGSCVRGRCSQASFDRAARHLGGWALRVPCPPRAAETLACAFAACRNGGRGSPRLGRRAALRLHTCVLLAPQVGVLWLDSFLGVWASPLPDQAGVSVDVALGFRLDVMSPQPSLPLPSHLIKVISRFYQPNKSL